jgi:small subunit ribosomal protein S20
MATNKLKKKIAKGRHASTIKRDRQSEKHRTRNKHDLSEMKTIVKAVRAAKTPEALAKAIPLIAKTAQKGVIHRRKASRLISRLTKAVTARA